MCSLGDKCHALVRENLRPAQISFVDMLKRVARTLLPED